MPLIDQGHDLVCGCRRAKPNGFTTSQATRHYPPDLSIEPVHLDIDLRVDVDAQAIEGTVTHTLKVRSAACVLVLHAVDLEVDAVRDLGGAEVAWRHDGEDLMLTWPEDLSPGTQHQVAIDYAVIAPRAGLYFGGPTEHNPDAPRWACTDHETERARHWLPCVDLPQVRCRLDFHLRADADFDILANGRLVDEEEHGDGTKTAHWRLEWPCPSYITCFALGEFTRAQDGEFEGIEIAYFARDAHTEENLSRTFGRTGEMLAWLTELLDQEFPFPKYYQFALPGIGGAMENISLVSWDEVFVLDEELAKEWGWLIDQINIHEMAHSYFGDAIVCRDFAHAWLKESWATYIETCWLEHKYGADEQLYDFYRNREAYFAEADNQYKRPIVTNTYDTSWQMYDRHLYPGGAARMHMLRKLLGDDVFWQGVRRYVAEYMGEAVETADFRRALERHSGRSLVRFFEQWIHSPGYPAIKATFKWDESSKQGTFTIEQTQVKEDGDEPTFEMPLTLGWRIDGTDHTADFEVSEAKHQFVVAMSEKPEFVRVDPHNELVIKLEFNPGEDMLRAQLTDAPDVIGRILAARTLADTGKRKNLRAIADAYPEEDFWGVRASWVTALSKAGTQAAMEAVLEVADVESDPMVLETVIRAMGQFQDDAVAQKVAQMVEQGVPYRARQAAYEVLGAQRDEAQWERLLEGAKTREFAAFPQAGAIHGLAATRRAEAVSVLIEHSEPESGYDRRVRASAASALGVLAKYVEDRDAERAADHLERLLRDGEALVRDSAASGLIAAKAKDRVAALRAYMQTLSHQDQVVLQRGITRLLKAQDPKVKEVESKLDDLKKEYRTLVDRLESLEAKADASSGDSKSSSSKETSS